MKYHKSQAIIIFSLLQFIRHIEVNSRFFSRKTWYVTWFFGAWAPQNKEDFTHQRRKKNGLQNLRTTSPVDTENEGWFAS